MGCDEFPYWNPPQRASDLKNFIELLICASQFHVSNSQSFGLATSLSTAFIPKITS
jgi:hypothetical protein